MVGSIMENDYEKRLRRIVAIGEIHNAGFEVVHRHDNTVEPMLMGGLEYYARRGSYLLVYNLGDVGGDRDGYICLQKTESNWPDWDGEFIIKFLPFKEFDECLSLTIAMKIGSDYYNGL